MKILGITHPYSHNNAACLIVDGKLIAFAEEERFVRYKHAPRISAAKATAYCLKEGGLAMKDLDYIAVGLGDWHKAIWPNLKRQSLSFAYAKTKRIIKNIRDLRWYQPYDFRDKRVINVNHHRAHLASSFFLSGIKEANLISLDGAGDAEAGLLGYGRENKIDVFYRVSNQDSWGALYEDITKLVGFKKHSQEGKTMGLASYGKADPSGLPFIDWQAKPFPKIDYRKKKSFLASIKGRRPDEEITQAHKDLAATLQYSLERAVLAMARHLRQKTGSRNLCLAGGVALNCAMNGTLLRSDFIDHLYIQPASSDAGSALGAAVGVYVKKTGYRPNFVFDHAYWGPKFNNREIEEIIKECKASKWHYCENIFKETAEKIAQNKIVGWFQGRMEVGPRALGGRSILANPSLPEMKDMINNNVKKREPWRPFAPSVLEEDATHYVENYCPSPFMILSFKVKPEKTKELVASAHIDNTVRLQSVSQKTNPRYWRLIDEFKKISGLPAVLNTSFNLAGEPIVCSPRDALRTFYGSGMDCLAIGDYLIEK